LPSGSAGESSQIGRQEQPQLLRPWRRALRRGRVSSMVPPTWLDAAGRRRRPLACWTRGRETAPMRITRGEILS